MLNLLIAVLAVWEAVEIWHHSALFAGLRARVELETGKISEALQCMFCLTPWVSLIVVLWLGLSESLIAPRPLCLLVQSPIIALAVARAANLGNDLTHRFNRTPKPNTLPPLGGDESEDGPPASQ